MRIEYYQDGELMVENCSGVEFATPCGDILITYNNNKADYLIIDRANFIGVFAE